MNVEPVTLTVALVVPLASTCRPSLPVVAFSLLNVLPVTVRLSVPLLSLMIALLSAEPVIVEFVIETVPVRPLGEPVPLGEKSRPSLFSPETLA